jgi:hypothetical protein
MRNLVFLVLSCLLVTACSEDEDFVPPAFLHIDAVEIVPPSSNAITLDPGFYTSEVTAVYAVAHYPDARNLDTLGLFHLPFTVPVLHSGDVDYLELYPAVKQSGVSGSLPYYTFYKPIRLKNLTLTTGDTLRLGTLSTTYGITLSDVLMYEFFEPTEGSLLFDSVDWVKHDPSGACTGEGYATVHVPDSMLYVPFAIKRDFYVSDPSRIVYLELDTRSTLPFEVYMHSYYTTGGSIDMQRVMVVNPSDHWQHMYINLGRTWSWFNHNPQFQISFAALNYDGVEGDIRIDNVKLITTANVL